MLPTLTLIPIYVLTFFSIRVNEVSEPITNNTDFSKVVNFVPEIENSDLNIEVFDEPEPERQIENSEFDSQIRMLHWKLKKNLETLVFLRELEARYENTSVMTTVIKEYYNLKEEIQTSTIEITNQLSYYKAIQTTSA